MMSPEFPSENHPNAAPQRLLNDGIDGIVELPSCPAAQLPGALQDVDRGRDRTEPGAPRAITAQEVETEWIGIPSDHMVNMVMIQFLGDDDPV